MPTPSTVTASVSEPTPIPERPTLYALVGLRYTRVGPHAGVDTQYARAWDIFGMSTTPHEPNEQQRCAPGSVLVTIPGSAEQASKAEPKDGSAKVEPAQCMFRGGSIRCYKYAGQFSDFCPDHTPAPTPKAEPKPKRGHVCDTRCMGDSGHHSWPAPRPDECLCNQELAGRPVFCPSCANKPKPHQSVNITDMIPKPADEGKVDGPPQSPAEAAELDVKRYDMRVTYMVNVPCVTSHEVCDGAWVIYHDVEKIVRALRAENQRQAGEIEELKKRYKVL